MTEGRESQISRPFFIDNLIINILINESRLPQNLLQVGLGLEQPFLVQRGAPTIAVVL